MKMKAGFTIMVILIIILSFAAFQALQATQNAGEPVATKDACTAIIEASMQAQENTESTASDDPALEPCLEALTLTGTSIADLIKSAPIVAGPDDIYIPITIINSNSFADAGRVWLMWHDPETGEMTASLASYSTRISYYNMGLDITMPKNVVNIGFRIETNQNRDSGKWEFNSGCSFAFATAPENFSVTVDDNNICSGQIEKA